MLVQKFFLAGAHVHNVVPSLTVAKIRTEAQKEKEKVSKDNLGVPSKKC